MVVRWQGCRGMVHPTSQGPDHQAGARLLVFSLHRLGVVRPGTGPAADWAMVREMADLSVRIRGSGHS